MMRCIEDMNRWTNAWLDTPLCPPRAASPQEAMRTPGLHVKSREQELRQSGEWPKYHGLIVAYDEEKDYVLVRSLDSPVSPRGTIWEGTIQEYYQMWECD